MACRLCLRHACDEMARRRLLVPVRSCAACAIASNEWRRPISSALIDGESGTGKGAGRAADSRDQRPPAWAVRAGELRGARRNAARGRALRHRRSDGNRRARTPRQIRMRRWRHAVSRRSRRSVTVGAGQAVAGASGSGGRACRRSTDFIASTRGSSPPPTRSSAALVEARMFRADLFYRLAGIEIHVPPLRERREDILELASYFLARHEPDAPAHALAGGRRRAAHLRLARQRPRARAHDGAHARAGAARDDRGRRPADPHPRRVWRRAAAIDGAQRHAARMGQPVRQAGPRAQRAQQAQGVPRARYQLSHAAGVSAIRAPAAGRPACRSDHRSTRKTARPDAPGKTGQAERGTAGAVWGHAHVRLEDICLGPHR